MRPNWLIPLLIAATAFAGCLGNDDDTGATNIDAPIGDPAGTDLAWGLENCLIAIAIVPVPADAVQDHLAEGFVATVPDGIRAMLPPDPRMEAILGIEAFSCDAGLGLNGSVPDLEYASIWTGVEAPENATGPEASLTFYKWDTLVPDAERREVLAAAGLPVQDGSVSLNPWITTPLALAMDISFHMDDAGEFRIVGDGLAPAEFNGDFTEYQPGTNGHAIWYTKTSAEAAYGGGGYVELAAGSIAEHIVGASRADAYILAARGGAFSDGFIQLP